MATLMSRLRQPSGIGLLVAALLLAGCTRGEGPVLTQSRNLEPFSRVEVGSGIHLAIRFGPAEPIVVHAQANIQDKVRTGVRNGVLQVEANGDIVVADPVVIDVVIPALEAVSLSGGAQVDVTGLAAEAMDIALSGGARATMTGAAGSLTLTARGGSAASLEGLATETVSVDLDGGSSAEVTATGVVSGSASGGAQLHVSGGGSVSVDTSGGAEVTTG